ncbi:MAG: hypothetical protein FJ118_19475 [Deltaproteobacteria bacterium]|nr:hypothetical protein [Deltaproteobacteria bacterium]
MKSVTSERFRKALAALPPDTRRQARAAYRLFKQNPRHPSLRFKPIHPSKPIYSIRISIDYRAVAIREADKVVWFWIGSHQDYEKLISQL